MEPQSKATDASKVELTDEQLDTAEGGASYIKFDGIDGESLNGDRVTESISLNFAKVEYQYFDQSKAPRTTGIKTIKW